MPKQWVPILNGLCYPSSTPEYLLSMAIFNHRRLDPGIADGHNVASTLFIKESINKFSKAIPYTSAAIGSTDAHDASLHSERLSFTEAIKDAINLHDGLFTDLNFPNTQSVTLEEIRANPKLIDALKSVDIHIYSERDLCYGHDNCCSQYFQDLSILLENNIFLYHSMPTCIRASVHPCRV
jgi:hypothetical protein